MKLRSLGATLRIARRDALRAKGRSALVVAMIALPVLGVTGADIVHRSGQLTPAERTERLLGGADAYLTAYAPGSTVHQLPFADDGAYAVAPREGQAPTPEQARGAGTVPADLLRELLPGATLLPAGPGPTASAASRHGLLQTDTAEADLTDPVWKGRITLVEGRAPKAPHEAAVTRAFLDESGLGIGSTTTLKGLEKTPFTLTGVVEHPGDLGKVEFVGRPGEVVEALTALAPAAKAPTGLSEQATAKASWLVKAEAGKPLDWAGVQRLNQYGFTATARTAVLHPPADAELSYRPQRFSLDDSPRKNAAVVAATVAGMALLEVALLAGPAFAVGARRSRRQLALLAAGGGDRGHVAAVVLGGGLVLGVAGAALGVVGGTGLVAALRPWIEETAGNRFGHFGLRATDLAAIGLVGLVTALLAAALPALQAARQSVTAGLTGRDTVKPPSRWTTALGAVLFVTGAATALLAVGTNDGTGRGIAVFAGLDRMTLMVLAGSVTAELGLLALTPLLVSLCGRLARFLPLSGRLALRDSARHRGRTAPAIAAVMAAVAGSVAVGLYTASTEARDRETYRPHTPVNAVTLAVTPGDPQLPRLRSAVEQDMPGLGERADLSQALYSWCQGCSSEVTVKGGAPRLGVPGLNTLVVGDAAVLHNAFDLRDPAADQALAAGKAVVFDASRIHDGKVLLQLTGGFTSAPQPGSTPRQDIKEIAVDAVLVDNPAAARYGAGVVGARTVEGLGQGVTVRPVGAVWLPATAPDHRSQQRAEATTDRLAPLAQLSVERGFQPKGDLPTLALTGFAALVVLGAACIATGLAAADSRRDQATLAAIGAPPGIRRRLSGVQCAVIAVLGAALGTVNGFVPALALLRTRAIDYPGATNPVVVPWGEMALTALAVPLLAGLLTGLFTRSRAPLTRRLG
ncbi:FtsX-like permease family protein [Kitasatospora sp. RG8]|uniref:FtsX-like permease family protein n=1 Tax=Kitasatospora sp. RG8 TaxID=2820815 RepID=UPI001AE090BC|nr:FtsX-like permease family protein [Kitasatospora sp. RG8]MBP0448742.1 FtsX-like permease family protein [Kitasatospora sp. RG8]